MSCKYNNCKGCGYKSECEIFKENAELKKKKEEIEIMTNFCKACKKMHTDNLTKAKTYLKYFIEILKRLRANKEPLVIEAEQFLNSEVEK